MNAFARRQSRKQLALLGKGHGRDARAQLLDEGAHARLERGIAVGGGDQPEHHAHAALVARVQRAESEKTSGKKALSAAVARYFFKLMAYKDEYEVARLYANTDFKKRIAEQFEGDYKLSYHLAPPMLAKKNDKGELIKKAYGPWVLTAFKLLAKLKGLRGTAFDVFGKTEERKGERALIGEYRDGIDALLPSLSAANLSLAVEIARIPEDIRGYGHVRERHLKTVRPKWAKLMADWRAGGQQQAA